VLLGECIDVGVRQGLAMNEHIDEYDRAELTSNISKEIWLQLDTYFNFEE
jgi:hypothetical protein